MTGNFGISHHFYFRIGSSADIHSMGTPGIKVASCRGVLRGGDFSLQDGKTVLYRPYFWN